jgi:uncharacterized Zn-finger protein
MEPGSPFPLILRIDRDLDLEFEGDTHVRQRHGTVTDHLDPPNAERTYRVTASDLPLHCPLPSMYLWNSHPKVYLPIEKTGEAKCPYCSTSYELVAEDAR